MDSYEEENYCSKCHRWYKDLHDCSEDRFEQQADDRRSGRDDDTLIQGEK